MDFPSVESFLSLLHSSSAGSIPNSEEKGYFQVFLFPAKLKQSSRSQKKKKMAGFSSPREGPQPWEKSKCCALVLSLFSSVNPFHLMQAEKLKVSFPIFQYPLSGSRALPLPSFGRTSAWFVFLKRCVYFACFHDKFPIASLNTTECTYCLAEMLLCIQLARVLCIFQQGSPWTGRPEPLHLLATPAGHVAELIWTQQSYIFPVLTRTGS